MTALGSNVDRHANLGDGELGRKGMRRVPVRAAVRRPGRASSRAPARPARRVERADIDNAWKLRKQGLKARGG